MRTLLLISVITFLASCSNPESLITTQQSFDNTLAVHLNAIKNRDLATLAPTVSDSVILIMPDGGRLNSKKSFMKLHEDWFSQKNWQWEETFLRTENTDSLGYALVRYTYTQRDSLDAIVFQNKNYLVLIFKNSGNGWQLVHDQNTRIPE